ncbi:hypothetical protein VTO73DRAFT_15458 [Trametes versicolor]
MASSPSYEDLASWDDLTLPFDPEVDDPDDLRRVDPRQLPPDISELDKTISELEAQLSDLRLQRERLLDRRALIHRLPPELLCRIFELSEESVELLPSLNLRSQATKLLVDIDFRYVDSFADCQTIMAEIKPALSRCYSCTLSVQDWPRMRVVQQNATELGPALEDFYLRLDSVDPDTDDPCNVLAQPCSRLAYVVLEHIPLECVNAPMPALRELSLILERSGYSSTRMEYPFKRFMSMIVASPIRWLNMRMAAFSLDSTDDLFQADPVLIELPELRGIEFDLVEATSIILFLQSTSLPSLSYISANSAEDMQWLSHIALSPERFPSLRLLDVRNFNFNGVGLAPFVRALHHLPRLTGLGFASPASGIVGSRLFEVLSAGPDMMGGWLLPRLEALCFQSCADISGHEILRAVNARRGAAAADVSKISYLRLTHCYSVDPEALERLKALVDVVLSV